MCLYTSDSLALYNVFRLIDWLIDWYYDFRLLTDGRTSANDLLAALRLLTWNLEPGTLEVWHHYFNNFTGLGWSSGSSTSSLCLSTVASMFLRHRTLRTCCNVFPPLTHGDVYALQPPAPIELSASLQPVRGTACHQLPFPLLHSKLSDNAWKLNFFAQFHVT